MKNMMRLGVILAIYSTIACVGLAFVYTGTMTVIAERQKADLEAALKDLFPAANGFEDISGSIKSADESVTFVNEYLIKNDATPVGIAVRAQGKSYGGPTTILVGIGADRKVAGVKVLENKDTPGLGANAASPTYFVDRKAKTTFTGQFSGKSIDDRFEVKGDVVAITASTITSKAIAGVVKAVSVAAGPKLAPAASASAPTAIPAPAVPAAPQGGTK
ncbi:MAG: FMN-binding protein [Treponemataceae bacterium]